MYFGAYSAPAGRGSGSGPWVGADMENGVFYGGPGDSNASSLRLSDFVAGFA